MDLSYLPASEITCWLPVATSPFFVEDYYGNRLLYPKTLPSTEQYRLLDLAILRAQLRRLAAGQSEQAKLPDRKDQAATPTPMEVPGYFSVTEQGITIENNISRYCTDAKEVIAVLLDALEPSTTQFFLQKDQITSYLGFAVCLEGEVGPLDGHHLSFQVTSESGKHVMLKIVPNDLVWCSWASQEEIIVSFRLTKARILGQHKGSVTIPWSSTGFVIDTRGRPFTVPDDSPQGKAKLLHWQTVSERIQLLPI